MLERYIELANLHDTIPGHRKSVLGIARSMGYPGDMRKRRINDMISISAPKETGMSTKELLSLPSYEYRCHMEAVRKKSKDRNDLLENLEGD